MREDNEQPMKYEDAKGAVDRVLKGIREHGDAPRLKVDSLRARLAKKVKPQRPVNLPAVGPFDPKSEDPVERGCVVHPFPNREQRRRAEREERRAFASGKLSAKKAGVGKIVAMQAEADAYAWRDARRKMRKASGLCPACGRGDELDIHKDCAVYP